MLQRPVLCEPAIEAGGVLGEVLQQRVPLGGCLPESDDRLACALDAQHLPALLPVGLPAAYFHGGGAGAVCSDVQHGLHTVTDDALGAVVMALAREELRLRLALNPLGFEGTRVNPFRPAGTFEMRIDDIGQQYPLLPQAAPLRKARIFLGAPTLWMRRVVAPEVLLWMTVIGVILSS